MAGGGNPVRAIFFALLANFGIALAKSVAAFYTASSAMLAEAIHSFADTGNQLLLLLGLRHAQKPPDEEHPLGYGKVTYFWSFIVALLLFSIGGLFSLYEGWHKLHEPEPISQAWIALLVLGVSIALESVSMAGCMREVNAIRGSMSVWRWLKSSRSSELVVVFGEDFAALLGLVVAFSFVALAAITGNPVYDAYGSLAIGALLVLVAAFIGSLVAKLLIGRSADPEVTAAISKGIADDPQILEVFNVITLQVGSQFMLAAKVRLDSSLPLGEAVRHINALEARLKAEVPGLGWSFMEMDSSD
ncbi:MAG: cation diffusion facilitator family transporter [bacterium]|nr:cation diffusion facilitator family transporter [bacterium]